MEGSILCTAQDVCLLSNGSEDRGSDMNDYFEDRLRSMDESRLADLVVISTIHVEDIMEARVPLPDTTTEEPSKLCSLFIDEQLREHLTGEAETSTQVKSHFVFYSEKNSRMLEESPQRHKTRTSSRVTFEIGDEETTVAKRVVIREDLCSRSQTEIERTGTDIMFPVIESIGRIVAVESNPPTISATVQQVHQPGFPGFVPGKAGGTGLERSRYYPSQSEKTLLIFLIRIPLPCWIQVIQQPV